MVVVVLDDVFYPLVAVQMMSTLRFWLMTTSSLGNVDLGEILFNKAGSRERYCIGKKSFGHK